MLLPPQDDSRAVEGDDAGVDGVVLDPVPPDLDDRSGGDQIRQGDAKATSSYSFGDDPRPRHPSPVPWWRGDPQLRLFDLGAGGA